MTDIKRFRTTGEAEAIKEYPQDYAEGILKGIEIYEKGFGYRYVNKVADRNTYRHRSMQIGKSYGCGLFEGWYEAEQNDVSVKQMV